MRITGFLPALLVLSNISIAQGGPVSPLSGQFEFVEIKYGIAEVVLGTTEQLKKSPTGSRGNLAEFRITKITDSVHAEIGTNFGVEYMIKAKDTFDIEVVIEWIFPGKMKNDEGKKFKTIKYSTRRPTNTETASSYQLEKPFEIIKGNWIVNIYIQDKLRHTRTFILY